ncbi:EpsG family protein [Flavobacterium covae]|nr:EpsG family protein [Flavobacterium covae]QYS91379.1 EpsG family protein [Flavobacterium covae]
MIYFFTGSFISFFAILEQVEYKRWFSNLFSYFFTLVLILFVSLRDGSIVGTDSAQYFENYRIKFWETELGYYYLNSIFSNNDIHYNVFLFIINSICLANLYKFIRFNSSYFLLPLLIFFSDFFLYYNFSGIRQGIALSFTCLAVNYFIKGNKAKTFLSIVLGAMFHITSLVFLIIFVIPSYKMKLKNYLRFFFAVFSASFIANFMIDNIEYLSLKFQYYSEIQQNPENIQTLYIVGILKRVLPFLGLYLVRKEFFENQRNVVLFNLYFVGFIVYLSTYLVSPDFGVRFSTYFTIMDTVIIGNVIWLERNYFKKYFLLFLYLTMAFYKIYTYSILDVYDYIYFVK